MLSDKQTWNLKQTISMASSCRARSGSRGMQHGHRRGELREREGEKESLPNPLQAAAASALSFSVGAMVPLLSASFITEYKVRVGVVIGAVSLALLVFGWLGGVLGKAATVKSAVRVLVGGWLAMAITFGLTKASLVGGLGLYGQRCLRKLLSTWRWGQPTTLPPPHPITTGNRVMDRFVMSAYAEGTNAVVDSCCLVQVLPHHG
ncbi:Vacuolar iron transporter-like protein 1 [Hibiscus syriacus]|uniref:Vacuolar iron transporter n=1 Tax=Hibiscus syriacus TaxID=106335 RepID=A0A6A2YVZ5_HIBSY|nr:Vacuolar iron transporter-like protein 1 [Hibiscus syriacus]